MQRRLVQEVDTFGRDRPVTIDDMDQVGVDTFARLPLTLSIRMLLDSVDNRQCVGP